MSDTHMQPRNLPPRYADLPPVEAGRRVGLREAANALDAIRLAGKTADLDDLARMLRARAGDHG